MEKEPQGITSPYVIDFDKYTDSFATYDDLPASVAWIHSVGAALGKKFGVKVVPNSERWEIDFTLKEARVGSIDEIYTRKGVLGLLLNGIGRLALGMNFPSTKKEAEAFAKSHAVKPDLAKHFGAITKTIDEIRTDDTIAKEYAGGSRVVDTMHAQAYEGANKALTMMAMDMRVRREMARMTLDWFKAFMFVITDIAKEPSSHEASKKTMKLAKDILDQYRDDKMKLAVETSLGQVRQRIEKHPTAVTNGRVFAVVLMALYPDKTDDILKVTTRSYKRNITAFGSNIAYQPVNAEEETMLIKLAGVMKKEVDEVKQFAAHTGGHAQYVIAKAEQYYHAYTLGIEYVTPFAGYDIEAKALDVERANEVAREIAQKMVDRGITVDIGDSITFAKEMLPLLAPFPFLDLNDQKKEGNGGQSNMGRRLQGSGQGERKQKRQKEKEKKSRGDRAMDRKKMESMDNKKNQEKVDAERGGYSILGKTDIDPLERYLYIIGPYLSRIATVTGRIRRLLKVNDPAGLRGAHRKGKSLNPRILYRHRLDDYRLFAKKEVDKDQSYGFVIMGDLSGSTAQKYKNGSNRQIQDEVLAAAFLMAEVAERIGDKILCSVGFFCSSSETVKRAGTYLNRSRIVTDIKDHGGGTNVEAAGEAILEDLEEMQEFKMKNKTIVFITDGSFDSREFLETVKGAKKYKASIAYFQICDDVSYGVEMCKEVENFVASNAKGVRIRTRNITSSGISALPEAMAHLLKETVGFSER